ncbi:MAG: ParB N-terminal domain-containing protein, partial [Planctomycetota bacterium]
MKHSLYRSTRSVSRETFTGLTERGAYIWNIYWEKENNFVWQTCRFGCINSDIISGLAVLCRFQIASDYAQEQSQADVATHEGANMAEKRADKPRHLGRGLQSLLGPIIAPTADGGQTPAAASIESNFPPDKELRDSLRHLSIDAITTNPYQARTVWNEEELAELTESIKANGIIQPIVVRPAGLGYQLIAGERRFRAAKLADLAEIPALVR